MKRTIEGILSSQYSYCGHETYEIDGINPFDCFKGKKIRVTIETMEN